MPVARKVWQQAVSGIQSSFYENADEARVAYGQFVTRIKPLAPMKAFEATTEQISISFRHIIKGSIGISPYEVYRGFRGLFWQLPEALWRGHRLFALVLGWFWIRSTPIERPTERFIGSTFFLLTACAGMALAPLSRMFHDTVLPGGTLGFVAADLLVGC